MTTAARTADRRRSVVAGLMIGVSTMAALDTIVFHQVLGWHHSYDRSTPDIGLLSDGLLQAVYLVLLVGGLFLLADIRRDRVLATGSAWGAFALGLGAFQLFDGVGNHQVLQIHQIRYGVDDLAPYDLAWNLGAVALTVAGVLLLRRTRHEGAPAPIADRGAGT